jgi:hypothetical protein
MRYFRKMMWVGVFIRLECSSFESHDVTILLKEFRESRGEDTLYEENNVGNRSGNDGAGFRAARLCPADGPGQL